MVISFKGLGSHGRLGNQLFQVASTLGLAERHKARAVFPAWGYQKFFENTLEHAEAFPPVQVQETYFHHYDWQLGTGDTDILGYLQSEKYFGTEKLKLNPLFIEECKKQFDIFHNETICIQVRRGDYVRNPNYYQLTPEFYIDALATHFPNWREMNILIISDDIEWCKIHFQCLPNVYFSNNVFDIQDMALGSCCDHFIISNSTFGWWTAWLGEKPHSKIVHSGHLFAGGLAKTHNTKDYRPSRWIEHKKGSYKIDLTDLTFTIPVYMDHTNRRENLELILCMLQQSFDSNYIISEWNGSNFQHMDKWAKYVKFNGRNFHRTKMLNDMSGLAKTPFIANWDADVIVPPAQLWLAVEELRRGADMVYPYDGRFGRMPRPQWFGQLQESLDIGIIKGSKLKGMEEDHNSVGGAVLWNKDSFIDGGMENENFISFGPEDCERHDRFKMLGYDIRRTGGALFHINHFVGPNSSPDNPFFRHNNDEIDKVRAMTRQELQSYIDTWSWRNPYTSSYYHRISESAIKSAEVMVEKLSKIGIKPKTVIDVGCGVGEWSSGGKFNLYTGIDYRIRKEDLLIDPALFIECDMNKSFPTLETKFDLCLCLEVAEHLKVNRANSLVEFLCSLSDRVLFSAAIPHQGGVGHVNEQWQTYWAELFKEHGFNAMKKQPNIRNEDMDLWYRQNTILYEKSGTGVVENFVLPEYYIQIVTAIKNDVK
ncbi:MAG: alpha-1,2-fucosyltransferase [Casimicrobiaceae bacterium]